MGWHVKQNKAYFVLRKQEPPSVREIVLSIALCGLTMLWVVCLIVGSLVGLNTIVRHLIH